MKESLSARVIPYFNVVSNFFRDDTKDLFTRRNKSQKDRAANVEEPRRI